jgi:hypothetical protein
MSAIPDHNQYTIEDIRKYVNGELTPAQMHAMEKAALDDPFLADAIEGYGLAQTKIGKAEISDELVHLKEALDGSLVRPRRSIRTFVGYAAAASILILLMVGGYYMFTEPGRQELADKKETTRETPQASLQSDSTSLPPTVSGTERPQAARDQPSVPKKSEELSPATVQSESANPEEQAKPAVPRDEQARTEPPAVGDVSEKEPSEALEGKAAGVTITNQDDASRNISRRNANNFNGKVTDDQGQPVSNAIVQIMPVNNALSTDKNGNFYITSPDTVLNVRVGSPGYETQNIALSNQNNQIVLQREQEVRAKSDKPAAKKSAVANREFSTANSGSALNAAPVTGWNDYQSFVTQFPPLAQAGASFKGPSISFRVNRSGKLSHFKVIESAGSNIDQLAIDYIQNGPKWQLFSGKNETVTISFNR